MVRALHGWINSCIQSRQLLKPLTREWMLAARGACDRQIGFRPAGWNPILMGWPTGGVSLMVRALHGINQLHSVETVASTAHPRTDVGRQGDVRSSWPSDRIPSCRMESYPDGVADWWGVAYGESLARLDQPAAFSRGSCIQPRQLLKPLTREWMLVARGTCIGIHPASYHPLLVPRWSHFDPHIRHVSIPLEHVLEAQALCGDRQRVVHRHGDRVINVQVSLHCGSELSQEGVCAGAWALVRHVCLWFS